jgi:hypothetical protein
MRRLSIITMLLALAPVASASAKEVTGMQICGSNGCAPIERSEAQRFHTDPSVYGAELEHGPGPVRWYRLTMRLGDGAGETIGQVRLAYAPAVDAIYSLDAVPATPWQRISQAGGARLKRAAAGLTPFAERRFEPEPPPKTAKAPEQADDGGLPLLAGVPAVALLLGVGLLVLRRR